jgi:hypothetical protein
MASIVDRRVTAHIQGDFVVFLVGMRVNSFWKPHKWLPNLRAMSKMLKELEAAPAEHGFLGYTNLGLTSSARANTKTSIAGCLLWASQRPPNSRMSLAMQRPPAVA